MKKSQLKQIISEEFLKMQKLAGIQINEISMGQIQAEMFDRMEGLINERDLVILDTKLRLVTKEWMNEGFEKEDVKDYISYLIDNI